MSHVKVSISSSSSSREIDMTEVRTNPFDFTLLHYATAWIVEVQHLFQLERLIKGTSLGWVFLVQLQHFVLLAVRQHIFCLIPA